MKTKKLYLSLVIILSILVLAIYHVYLKDTRESVQIAVVGPISGDGAKTWNLTIQAIKLYLDTINNKEKIDKKIVLKVFDDQNNPVLAKAKAIKIAEQNQAVAVIGHDYSSCSISGGEIYHKYGIPAISTSSTNVKVTENNPWYFRTTFNDNSQGRLLANYAKNVLGYNTVSIIHKDRTAGNYLAQVFRENAIELKMLVLKLIFYLITTLMNNILLELAFGIKI